MENTYDYDEEQTKINYEAQEEELKRLEQELFELQMKDSEEYINELENETRECGIMELGKDDMLNNNVVSAIFEQMKGEDRDIALQMYMSRARDLNIGTVAKNEINSVASQLLPIEKEAEEYEIINKLPDLLSYNKNGMVEATYDNIYLIIT